jgi:polysaccharide export outer membrane protein
MKPLALMFLSGLCLLLLAAPQPHARAQEQTVSPYRLSPGDDIRVTVAGEGDLSGPRRIDAGGAVTLPLVGAVNVAGLDPDAAAAAIAARLRDGYLRAPRVSVALESFRPVYLLGGINNPGEYQYREGMTVLQAVAMGGGFARSNGREHTAHITRRTGDSETTQVFPIDGTLLLPGDVLTIQTRWRYHE